jgi:hypothetical protein
MKARVKGTDVELEVHLVDKQARYIGSDGITYWEEDLDFGIEDKNNSDWTRLEQAAIAVMQGISGNQTYTKHLLDTSTSAKDARDIIVEASCYLAQSLIEKMKEVK